MNDKISVIVPVYNVQNYLVECLSSIINQTYKNIEIIIVDDGSTDNSYNICKYFANKDNRIILIHKSNEGLGFARNSGLEKASGAYVMFVDSDDYINTDMIEKLYKNLYLKNCDTVFCGYNKISNDGDSTPCPPIYGEKVYKNSDVINKVLLEMVGSIPTENEDMILNISVWHSLYSLQLIRQHYIKFPSERVFMSEDLSFNIDYLRFSKCVCFLNDCLYNYRCNENSLSKKYDPTRFERHENMYYLILNKLDDFLTEDQYLFRAQRRLLGGARGRIIDIVKYEKENLITKISNVINNKTLQEILSEYPYKRNPFRHKIFNFCLRKRYKYMVYIMAKVATK